MPAPNPQLFEHGQVQSLIANGEKSDVDKLFNQLDPNLAVLHEKPEHRQMLWMKARGASNREIAMTLGYTDSWVSQVMRQPWARRYLLEEMHKQGVDELATILKGAAVDSVLKLIELRDADGSPAAVQRNCAVDLLDRFMGKPVQRVEQTIDQTIDVTDASKLDEQIAQVEQQEAALTGAARN